MSLLLVIAPQMACEWVRMWVDCILQRLNQEWLVAVQISLFLLIYLSLFGLTIKKVFKGVLNVRELWEETASILQLNVTALFYLRVQVGLNLAATVLTDVAREQVARQISQWVIVASSERLVDSVLFFVREFVEHWTQIRHLIMVLHTFLGDVLSAVSARVWSGHGRLSVDVWRRSVRRVHVAATLRVDRQWDTIHFYWSRPVVLEGWLPTLEAVTLLLSYLHTHLLIFQSI